MAADPAIDARLIKESLALAEQESGRLVSHFYAEMFLRDPAIRNLFPAAMDTQRDRFLAVLTECVRGIDEPDFLLERLRGLGRGHRKYGVRPEHYATLGEALIATLRRHLGPDWTPPVEAAWRAAYALIARTMIAAQQAEDEPASWRAEVVRHERPAADVAVLTLRPERTLPYRAGQHLTVETPWWPRVWRPYSIANAPRPDGLIELHVRSVGAGWVSGALVHRARPGDTLRLGPAAGTMTLAADSDRPVLCVGGGVGVAPIAAIAGELARAGRHRVAHVFYGARQASGLYALGTLTEIATRHGRLTVIPAVSDDPSYQGERALLPDVISRHAARFGMWARHDVYACGAPAMIRATLSRFQELGVPLDRVRYEAFGEM